MNLERYHLVKAHERIRDAADALQATLITIRRPLHADADDYYKEATTLLEDAVKELGGRIVWDSDPAQEEVLKRAAERIEQLNGGRPA